MTITINYHAWENPQPDGTTQLDGFRAHADFATDAEAMAFVVQFPKYVKVKHSGCSGLRDGKYTTWPTAVIDIYFGQDGTNKGLNETGLKRLRKFFEVCKSLDCTMVETTNFQNRFDITKVLHICSEGETE